MIALSRPCSLSEESESDHHVFHNCFVVHEFVYSRHPITVEVSCLFIIHILGYKPLTVTYYQLVYGKQPMVVMRFLACLFLVIIFNSLDISAPDHY